MLDKAKILNRLDELADQQHFGSVYAKIMEIHKEIESGTFDAPLTEEVRQLREELAEAKDYLRIKQDQVWKLAEERDKLVKALEEILTVTADGSTPDKWNGSTGGSGHATCRKIARTILSEIKGQGDGTNE